MQPSICFVAGRSGGHIIPALTQARFYKQQHNTIHFFSTNTQLDYDLIADDESVDVHYPLAMPNIPRKKIWRYPGFFWSLGKSLIRISAYFIRHQPEKIISTGGYVGVPVSFIARLCGIPVELYELNVEPGRAARLMHRYAATTHVCFAEAADAFHQPKACVQASYPVRFHQSCLVAPDRARRQLDISAEKRVILVIGGSQGARVFNKLLREMSHLIDARRYHIIHQVGADGVSDATCAYDRYAISHTVFHFSDKMALYYAAADIVVSRAGAGSLFEIDFFNKKAIIIPLPRQVTSHQEQNGIAFERAYPDRFSCVYQCNVTPAVLYDAIERSSD